MLSELAFFARTACFHLLQTDRSRTHRQHDGDREALGYASDRWTAAVGGDVEVGDGIIVGASIAKVSNKLDFRDNGRWNADGVQLGGYGSIDRGNFYAKIIGTLGWFDGNSRRSLDWRPFGGTSTGTLIGDADARLWTKTSGSRRRARSHFGGDTAIRVASPP